MNANNYLGLSVKKGLLEAAEESAERFGIGPGSVRFISGTFKPHVDLEKRLAQFHGRESGMLFSSAYVAMVGTLFSLISQDTIVIRVRETVGQRCRQRQNLPKSLKGVSGLIKPTSCKKGPTMIEGQWL